MHEPGDLVWAKMKGYPPWPAMVMDDADVPVETPSGKHPVLFFGTNETGFMKTSELFPYLKHRRAYEKTRRVKGFRKAVQEIRREAGLDASNLPKESESMEEMDFAKALGKSRFATKAQTGGTKGKAAQDTATSSKASESPRKRRLSNRAAAEQTPLSLKRSRQPSEVKMEPEEPLPVNFDISVDSSTEGSRHEEEERAALLVEYQQSIQAAAKASKPKRPKTKLKVAIRKSKPTKACPAAAPRVPEPENIHGNLQECGACGSGVRPETGGAVGCYRLRCSNKSCRKWWGVVDRDKWMEEMNYVPKRMKDIDQLRASAAKKSFSPLGSRSGEGVLDLEKELADFDPVAADDALEGLGDILGLEDSVMQSPEGRKTKRVSFEPLKHEDLELTECGVCGQEGSSCPCSGWDSGARPGPSALRGTKRTAPRRKGSSAKGPKTKVPRRAPTVTDSVDETVTVIASGRSWGGDSETEGEARSSPLDTSSRGIVETKSRWWLRSRGMSREMSPPRALTTTPMDAAAVFRIIGGSLESLGERLRSAPDESPGAVAGTLDLLLDSLMASLPPLLSLAGMVDGIPALPAERLAELEERTTPLIPMFNQ